MPAISAVTPLLYSSAATKAPMSSDRPSSSLKVRLRAMAMKAREENEMLKARLDALEAAKN